MNIAPLIPEAAFFLCLPTALPSPLGRGVGGEGRGNDENLSPPINVASSTLTLTLSRQREREQAITSGERYKLSMIRDGDGG